MSGEDSCIYAGGKIVRGGNLQYRIIGNNVTIGTESIIVGNAYLANRIAIDAHVLVNKNFNFQIILVYHSIFYNVYLSSIYKCFLKIGLLNNIILLF